MIPIKNVYYMLTYAYQILNEQGYRDVALEEFDNIGELCSAILAKGMSVQLKRGLYKAYTERTESLTALRGKIDLTDTVRTQSLRRQQLVCTYDEFNENSYLNRIIKSTMLALMHQNIKKKQKRELRKILMFLENVDTVELRSINWRIPYNQNNQSYRMLIGICYLVVKGLLQTTDDGTVRMMDFIEEDKLFDLYERFLRQYYRTHYPRISVSASKIDWLIDEGFQAAMLPEMRSDITLEYKNRVLIIDAKFYQSNVQEYYGAKKLLSDNVYQIFTYVMNKAGEKDYDAVSGLLLYARTDEEIQPDENTSLAGHRISARTLDLNRDFTEIKKNLNAIVEEFLMAERIQINE